VRRILDNDHAEPHRLCQGIRADAVAVLDANPLVPPRARRRERFHHGEHAIGFGRADNMQRHLFGPTQCALQDFAQLPVGVV
jgi:hypothetical protein